MKRTLTAIIMVLAICIFGCTAKAPFFTYQTGEIVNTDKKHVPVKVAVFPFEDIRTDNNVDSSFLNLVPLVLYGSFEYDRPDAAGRFLHQVGYNFRPSEDIAKALVAEMKQNKFFDEVFLSLREKEPGIDFIVNGKIKKTKYSAKWYTYGLSGYGVFTYFFGVPVGTVENSVEFTVQLVRVADGVVVWQHGVTKEWNELIGLYYNTHAGLNGFPIIIKDGLVEGMKKLSSKIDDKGNFILVETATK